MKINTYQLETGMGRVITNRSLLPFSEKIIDKISDIGYNQTRNNIELWTELLNGLSEDKTYKIEQLRWDDGEGREVFNIIEVDTSPVDDTPKKLDEMNFEPVISMVEDYIEEVKAGHVDDDTKHYIFEAAVTAVFGRDVWKYINIK